MFFGFSKILKFAPEYSPIRPSSISICRYMLIFVDVNALIQIGRYQAIFYQCHIKKYQVGYKDVCNV